MAIFNGRIKIKVTNIATGMSICKTATMPIVANDRDEGTHKIHHNRAELAQMFVATFIPQHAHELVRVEVLETYLEE